MLLLHFALVLAIYVPGWPILAHDKPAMCAVFISIVALFSPAPYTLCILPYQLGEMTGSLAETSRTIKVVFVALVAPGFYGSSGIRIAFGQVFSARSMLRLVRTQKKGKDRDSVCWKSTYRVLPETLLRVASGIGCERIIPGQFACTMLLAVEVRGV